MHKIEGAHLQYVNKHYAKFELKRMKNFGSYRLHKLGTPKVLRTKDRWSGPITRLAFANVTQVKNMKNYPACKELKLPPRSRSICATTQPLFGQYFTVLTMLSVYCACFIYSS